MGEGLKRTSPILILLSLLISILATVCYVQPAKTSGTIYIRADGLVEGTDKISNENNVTYTFTDNINDSIVVQRDNIIIDGAGYTLLGTRSIGGVDLTGRTNVTVWNIQIRSFIYGISLNDSSHNHISGNSFANNEFAIMLDDSASNSVIGNTMTENNYYGVVLDGSSNNNSVSSNNFANKDCCITLFDSSNNNISRNNITASSVGIVLVSSSHNNTISGNNIANNDNNIVLVSSSNNNSINRNNISEGDWGIDLSSSFNNSIIGNNITKHNHYSVYLSSSSNNSIIGNDIADNEWGIGLHHSSNNNISRNNITANHFYGVLLESSNHNVVNGNTFTNDGLTVWYSYQNIVEDNIVNGKPLVYLEDMADYTVGDAGQVILVNCTSVRVENLNLSRTDIGVQLLQTSSSSIIGNTIMANNMYGVGLGYSSDNRFYHNNFVDNIQQVSQDGNSMNFWDNGYEGNYWSNYNGVDLNHDGLGDTLYHVSVNNQDNYPLMGMFRSFDTALGYNMDVISNSSISNFELQLQIDPWQPGFNVTGIRFYVVGEASMGFCRICIPRGLLNVTYRVFVNGTEVSYTLLPSSNNTHCYLYFAYDHSTQEVLIIPEFTTLLILPLFMTATLVAAILYRRKCPESQQNHDKDTARTLHS